MYNATQLQVSTKADKIFAFFLFLYPDSYRKQYGNEMQLVFHEMYQEELNKNGNIRFSFWLSQVGDLTKSIIHEHIDEMQSKGMKKYLQHTLHSNAYNIVSIIFLLPVILMTGIEIISRVTQGDLTHYNRPVYNFFSHTFLYRTPVLFTWVILFPALAAIISLIPLVKSLTKKKTSLFSITFLRKNIFGIAIFFFGLGFIAFI